MAFLHTNGFAAARVNLHPIPHAVGIRGVHERKLPPPGLGLGDIEGIIMLAQGGKHFLRQLVAGCKALLCAGQGVVIGYFALPRQAVVVDIAEGYLLRICLTTLHNGRNFLGIGCFQRIAPLPERREIRLLGIAIVDLLGINGLCAWQHGRLFHMGYHDVTILNDIAPRIQGSLILPGNLVQRPLPVQGKNHVPAQIVWVLHGGIRYGVDLSAVQPALRETVRLRNGSLGQGDGFLTGHGMELFLLGGAHAGFALRGTRGGSSLWQWIFLRVRAQCRASCAAQYDARDQHHYPSLSLDALFFLFHGNASFCVSLEMVSMFACDKDGCAWGQFNIYTDDATKQNLQILYG